MKMKSLPKLNRLTAGLAALAAAAFVTPGAYAASSAWNSAPVDANWINAANWAGGVIPGTINNTANNGIDSASVASFTNAITTFGGAANPVMPDDATVVNGKARMLGRVVFDGPNCGAYVFNSLSAYAAQTATTPETGVLSLCVPTPVNQNGTNGSYITAGVTNPQTFLVPVQIRLPSSCTGWYGFTNNATSPNATYFFQRLFLYPGATTRGVTYIFTGSNTGTNTVALLQHSANQGGSQSGILKLGTGRWILSGANTFGGSSAVNINEGTLEVLDPAAFGAVASTASVNNTGILQIDGVTLNLISLGLRNSGMVRMNGSASLNGVSVNTGVGNTPTLATTSASDVFTVGTGLAGGALVSGGAVDTVLNTAGPGTLVFSQANTYVGKWSFAAKTNQLSNSSALGTGANADLGAGAILDLTPLGPGTSFTPTTTGFGGSGTGTTLGSTAAAVIADPTTTLTLNGKNVNLTFTPTGFSGDTTHPALIMAQGTLALGGNTFFINNASGTPLGVGTYRLMQQTSGSITSAGGYAALISGSGAVAGSTADIVVSGGNVDLVISIYVPKNLVWSGTGSNWDLNSTADWLDGVIASVFHNSDNVTFNSAGSANPSVTLIGTLAPATLTVDTSANDYTFTGAGQIAGTTSLIKNSSGTLTLGTVNTYAGGTVVNAGTVKLAVNNALSSLGAGDVAINGTATVDLNNNNNAINALNGSGSLDNTAGGPATLSVGNNGNSGVFSGTIKNTSGTVALTKVGTGAQTLSAANSYSGATTVELGTLNVGNPSALGAGDLVVNAGTVNLQTGVNLNSLTGAGGTIANNANASTNLIRVSGAVTNTLTASIINGSGGGALALALIGPTSLTLAGNNTYTGGTFVGSGATFAIPNSPAAVGGFLIASNNAIVNLSGGSGTPGTPNSVTTVDGATVTFNSGAEGKLWQCQWNGGVTATNRYIGPVSFNQPMSFSNFLGRVQFANAGSQSFRFNNALSGGDNTTFEFITGNVHINGAQTVRLGEILGGSATSGIGGGAGAGIWIIGTKNTSTTFQGYIKENGGTTVNLVKSGTGSLTLDGVAYYTNTVTLADPFEPTNIVNFTLSSNVITYLGSTTVSNGILKIVTPNNLMNSTNITLAGGTLDVTAIGYASNQTALDFNSVEQATNTVAVTTGVLDILAGQGLFGQGNLLGSVTTDPTATVGVGQGVGTLAISGSISLNGTVNMDLNRSNLAQNSDRLTAASFTGSGAVLNITNVGPTLLSGTTFQLFNHGVTAFSSVNLPATDATGQITYIWQNDIATTGSITLVSGLSAAPTQLTSTIGSGGTTLDLSWPPDHRGWTLQNQTNALNVGITGTWYDVPGSTTNISATVPVVPGNPTVFYRLTLPLP